MAPPKPGGFKLSLNSKNSKAAKIAAISAAPAKSNTLDSEDAPQRNEGSVAITGWDTATGGAVELNGKKEKTPERVIAGLANRNWREEARRKQQSRGGGNEGDNTEAYKESNIAYGLTVVDKTEKESTSRAPTPAGEDVSMAGGNKDEDDGLTEDQRLEKRAIAALISGEMPAEKTVIAAQSEEEAFDQGFKEAPDAPSLDAYTATPIDGFGASILRGYGWKDGEEIGRNRSSAPTKPREMKRRAALLGIGAKEEAAVGIELGEWGKGAKGSKRKVDQVYNPVILRNKETGEQVTEEELQKKMEQQQLVQEEEERGARRRKRSPDDRDRHSRRDERSDRSRRERNDDRRDRDRKDRHRDRDRDDRRERDREDRHRDRDRDEKRRDRDYDSRRERRDRSTSSDDRRSKRKHRDYDDDRDRSSSKRYRDDKYHERSKRDDRYDDKHKSSSRRREEVY